MILTPIKNLKDFVYNYNRDIMLGKCILQPLTPGLEEFVKTDTLGAELRKKALEKLSGALSKNDCTLWTWEKTIRDEFQDLHRWISHYTIGYGVSAGLTPEEAIEEVNQKLLKEGLEQQNLERLIHIEPQEWEEYKQEYEKEMLEERQKIVSNMGKLNIDNKTIASCLKITEAEVEKLLKE